MIAQKFESLPSTYGHVSPHCGHVQRQIYSSGATSSGVLPESIALDLALLRRCNQFIGYSPRFELIVEGISSDLFFRGSVIFFLIALIWFAPSHGLHRSRIVRGLLAAFLATLASVAIRLPLPQRHPRGSAPRLRLRRAPYLPAPLARLGDRFLKLFERRPEILNAALLVVIADMFNMFSGIRRIVHGFAILLNRH